MARVTAESGDLSPFPPAGLPQTQARAEDGVARPHLGQMRRRAPVLNERLPIYGLDSMISGASLGIEPRVAVAREKLDLDSVENLEGREAGDDGAEGNAAVHDGEVDARRPVGETDERIAILGKRTEPQRHLLERELRETGEVLAPRFENLLPFFFGGQPRGA